MADPEYAPLHIGVSITRGNSANGVPPTHGLERGTENAGQIADAQTNRPLSGNDRLHMIAGGRPGKLNPVTSTKID